MNKHEYCDWYNERFDDNAIAFAEKHEEEFDDFCFARFISKGVDKDEY